MVRLVFVNGDFTFRFGEGGIIKFIKILLILIIGNYGSLSFVYFLSFLIIDLFFE